MVVKSDGLGASPPLPLTGGVRLCKLLTSLSDSSLVCKLGLRTVAPNRILHDAGEGLQNCAQPTVSTRHVGVPFVIRIVNGRKTLPLPSRRG